jgi:hypothetical protein
MNVFQTFALDHLFLGQESKNILSKIAHEKHRARHKTHLIAHHCNLLLGGCNFFLELLFMYFLPNAVNDLYFSNVSQKDTTSKRGKFCELNHFLKKKKKSSTKQR